jgi:pimeloyl-ACP methyl ester carboxylesterase
MEHRAGLVVAVKIVASAGRGQPVILLHGTGGEGARWMPTIRALAPESRHRPGSDRLRAVRQAADDLPQRRVCRFPCPLHAGDRRSQGVARGSIDGCASGRFRWRCNIRNWSIDWCWSTAEAFAQGLRHRTRRHRTGMPGRSRTPGRCRRAANIWRSYHSFITDELVERNLIQRLRSAHTIESMQVAGDRGLGGLTEEEVRGIKAPTILVWGANDKISPPANADKLNAAIRTPARSSSTEPATIRSWSIRTRSTKW